MYEWLTISLQALLLSISLVTASCAILLIRDFLLIKRTNFKISVLFMAIFSLGYTLIDGIAPNEVIVQRLGLDKLPYTQSLLLVNNFLSTVCFYEFMFFYISASYLRSLSIIKLRPKYEQKILSVIVYLSVIMFQLACLFALLEGYYGLDHVNLYAYQIANLAGVLYFGVDVYYLIRFIGFIRSAAADREGKINPKLKIIGKYGIIQGCIFLTTLALTVTSAILWDEIFLCVMDFYISVQTAMIVLLFVKMIYDLKAEKSEGVSGVDKSAKQHDVPLTSRRLS